MGKLRRRALGSVVAALVLGLLAAGAAIAGKSHRSNGRTVRGTLYVDVFSNTLDLGGELVALPYEYTVS